MTQKRYVSSPHRDRYWYLIDPLVHGTAPWNKFHQLLVLSYFEEEAIKKPHYAVSTVNIVSWGVEVQGFRPIADRERIWRGGIAAAEQFL